MSSNSRDEFEEKHNHILLPARVLLPGDSAPDGDDGDDGDDGEGGAGTLEDEDGGAEVDDSGINGWTVRAVFEIEESDQWKDRFVALRFASTYNPYAGDAKYVEMHLFHSNEPRFSWWSNRSQYSLTFQERAGESYYRPEDQDKSEITVLGEEFAANVPGSNEVVVKVVGTQATLEVNGLVAGFLALEEWPLMTNVYAFPNKDGVMNGEVTYDDRHLVSLEAKRYIPPLAWGIFGAAGGVALVALLAAVVIR